MCQFQCRVCVNVLQQSSASHMAGTPMFALRKRERKRRWKIQVYLEVFGSRVQFRCRLCPCALVLHTSQQ